MKNNLVYLFLALLISLLVSGCQYDSEPENYNIFCRKVKIKGKEYLRTGYLNDQECCFLSNVLLRFDSSKVYFVVNSETLPSGALGKYLYTKGRYNVYYLDFKEYTDLYLFVKDGLIDGVGLQRPDGIYLRYYTRECNFYFRKEGSVETCRFEGFGSLDFNESKLSSCVDSVGDCYY